MTVREHDLFYVVWVNRSRDLAVLDALAPGEPAPNDHWWVKDAFREKSEADKEASTWRAHSVPAEVEEAWMMKVGVPMLRLLQAVEEAALFTPDDAVGALTEAGFDASAEASDAINSVTWRLGLARKWLDTHGTYLRRFNGGGCFRWRRMIDPVATATDGVVTVASLISTFVDGGSIEHLRKAFRQVRVAKIAEGARREVERLASVYVMDLSEHYGKWNDRS